jgi:type VI secretion system secreted protein VgrG
MAGNITQHDRLFSFDSPLGPDKLLVNSFTGTEQLSEIYHFELELVSEDFSLDWDQIIDRNVTVGIRQRDKTTFRYFNGYINRFVPVRHEGRLAYYSAEMVPWLWYLTQTTDSLIYQEKTIVQVVEATFQKYGFRDYDVKSLGDRHAKWINCCQYQETAFDFVSRLMEVEGVYYYFKHEQGKHTMMMVDHLSAHLPCPYQPTIRVEHQEGAGLFRDEDTIFVSNMTKVIKPNKYAHKDFNFEIPSHKLYYEAPSQQYMGTSRTLEIYDYPGEFDWEKDAPDWGDLRQEELEFDRTQVSGNGNCRCMMPGYRIDLTQHDRPEQNINYLITKVTHKGHEGSWGAGADAGEATYENTFSTMPSSVQFRPTRKTETPNIASIQTAHVVGPKGEEIYTDDFGRVKVHFHWDRKDADENSSCWIRVAQPISGLGFGHIWLPRVGQEVIVQFLEGDPDRPVITGCLYNHVNHPPYKLPDNKNWSGVKTRSTKNGKPTEFNELRFVDTEGDELFVIHAQKDMQISTENDTVEVVVRDRTLEIQRNQIEMVKGDKNGTVKGSLNQDIQNQMSLNVRQDINEKAGGNFILQAGGDIHLKAGGRIVLEAAGGITFIGAGGSFIDCTQSGIVIQGPKVQINCGLPAPQGAQSANPTPPNLPNLPDPVNLAGYSTIPNLVNPSSTGSTPSSGASGTGSAGTSSTSSSSGSGTTGSSGSGTTGGSGSGTTGSSGSGTTGGSGSGTTSSSGSGTTGSSGSGTTSGSGSGTSGGSGSGTSGGSGSGTTGGSGSSTAGGSGSSTTSSSGSGTSGSGAKGGSGSGAKGTSGSGAKGGSSSGAKGTSSSSVLAAAIAALASNPWVSPSSLTTGPDPIPQGGGDSSDSSASEASWAAAVDDLVSATGGPGSSPAASGSSPTAGPDPDPLGGNDSNASNTSPAGGGSTRGDNSGG